MPTSKEFGKMDQAGDSRASRSLPRSGQIRFNDRPGAVRTAGINLKESPVQTQACHHDSALETACVRRSRRHQDHPQVSSSDETMRAADGFDPTRTITIAGDSEYHGRKTLLIQVA